jgi:hypothetical protein
VSSTRGNEGTGLGSAAASGSVDLRNSARKSSKFKPSTSEDLALPESEAKKLFNRAKQWADQNIEKLRKARPDAPARLGHRQREVCRPLFAIADLCGNGWGDKVRAAIGQLFSTDAALPDDDINTRLLHDIRECFGESDRISSAELIEKLASMEDAPWSSWGKSHKPINQNQLSGRLRHFKVSSRPIRIGDRVPRGYLREQFESAWERYAPLTPLQGATVLQPASTQAESDFSGCYKNSAVALQKSEIGNIHAPCNTVALHKPEVGGCNKKQTKKPTVSPLRRFAALHAALAISTGTARAWRAEVCLSSQSSNHNDVAYHTNSAKSAAMCYRVVRGKFGES